MNAMAIALTATILGGLFAYLFSRKVPGLSQAMAFLCSIVAMVFVARVWSGSAVSLAPFRTAPEWLAPYGSLDLRFAMFEVTFRATKLGNLAALGSAFFGTLIALYMLAGFADHRDRGRLSAFLLWTIAGALVVSWADNLLLLLLGWETVTLMLYLMVNTNAQGARAAQKSFGILGVADIGMLLSTAFLLSIGRAGDLSLSGMRISVVSPGIAIAYLLFMVAALAKAGAIPLQTWLPPVAKDSPSAVSALLPASLDKLLGIYLLARMSLDVFVLAPWLKTVLMVIGGITILAAVLMAMIQHNLKRLLGFHAVSQVGYMVLGIGTGLPVGIAGGLFHMVNNALYKSGLFLMAGNVERYSGSAELEDLGGLARRLPWTFVGGVVLALAISGVPPFNGFASKWLVYQSVLSMGGLFGGILFVVAVFGSALTLASFVKVLHSVFWGPEPESHEQPRGGAEPFCMVIPMVIIAVLCIVLGVWASGSLGLWIVPIVSEFGHELVYAHQWQGLDFPSGLWMPGLATVLLIVGALLAGFFYLIGGVGKARTVDTFVAGERMGTKPPFYSGTNFYLTIQRLPIVGVLLREGEQGTFDIYHWCELAGGSLVALLKRIHSGLLNLYVAWVFVGLAILVLVLAL